MTVCEQNNVCCSLRNREVGIGFKRKRKDFHVLKTLICMGNRQYNVVSCRKSNKTFSYEGGRLFTDNYRGCSYGYAVNGPMKAVYKIPKNHIHDTSKLEDALIYSCYHDKFHEFENVPCLLALRTRELGESIVLYNLNTGQRIREICLPQAVKFKYIGWAETNEMFYVKSVHSFERSRFRLITGLPINVAVVVAVFSAFPMKFIGMFEVDRRIFGPGIINAIITHTLLVVMYITGHVKFFSFKYILQKFKVFDCDIDNCTDSIQSNIGERPCPLKMNIKITECPPVLLDVRCADQNVQIGGFPWHYMYIPRGKMGLYEVMSLGSHVQAEGGRLKAEFVHPDNDTCNFHGDGSGRIIFVSKDILRVFQLVDTDINDTRRVQKVATINAQQLQVQAEEIQMTSSGRCIKKILSVDEVSYADGPSITQLEYEDEMDIAWTMISDTGAPYRVRFYDNQSLQELREITLDSSESCNECYEQQIFVDLDTIVLVTKPRLGQFICTVYRLSGDLNQENQSVADPVKSSATKNDSVPKRRRGLRTRIR